MDLSARVPKVCLVLLGCGLIATTAVAADRVEFVVYSPAGVAQGAGGFVDAEGRLHADKGTVGSGLANIADAAIPDGMLFVERYFRAGPVPADLADLAAPLGNEITTRGEVPAMGFNSATGQPAEIGYYRDRDLQSILTMGWDSDGSVWDFADWRPDPSESRMHIDGQGNIGIGFSDPAERLEVAGSVGAGGGRVIVSRASPSAAGGIRMETGSVRQWTIGSQGTGTEDLYIRDEVSAVDRMHINAGSGAVGIGTVTPLDANTGITEPGAGLEVAGGVYFAGGNGDYNGDGTLAPSDVNGLISYLNNPGGTVLTPGQFARGDISGDGRFNGTDGLLMMAVLNRVPGFETIEKAQKKGRELEALSLGMNRDGTVVVGKVPDAASSSAKLAIVSATKGFLPPRMGTLTRNNIGSPVDGLMIYNLDTHQLECYFNGSWRAAGGPASGGGALFGPPDWDTGWINLFSFSSVPAGYPIEAKGYKVFAHKLETDNLFIYIETRDRDGSHGAVNRIYAARNLQWGLSGYEIYDDPMPLPHIWWQHKTAASIEILYGGPWPVVPSLHRVDQIRMRIWRID